MNEPLEFYLSFHNNEYIDFECESCGASVHKLVKSWKRNKELLCKACLMKKIYGTTTNIGRKDVRDKALQTKVEKYGDAYFNNRAKSIETNKEKYGVENVFQLESVKNKIKETLINRYGVDNPQKSEAIREKAENTNIEKYGSKTYLTSDVGKETIKTIIQSKYNADSVLANKDIHDKTVASLYANGSNTSRVETIRKNAEKLGKKWVSYNLDKIKETNNKRYGCDWFQQSPCYQLTAKKKYRYKGMPFDSSWEIAYWIWCEDNNIEIKRNTKLMKMSNGKGILIDFIVNGQLTEIKGDHLKKLPDWGIKSEFYLKHKVNVLFQKDIEPILKYVSTKYGKSYLKSFKLRGYGDSKRKIVELDNFDLDTLEKFKNKNIRYHYHCINCNTDVFTTYNIISRMPDGLCKYCRKSVANCDYIRTR